MDDAIELFRLRRAYADDTSIRRAHELTQGHAYWLDLLAAQVHAVLPRLNSPTFSVRSTQIHPSCQLRRYDRFGAPFQSANSSYSNRLLRQSGQRLFYNWRIIFRATFRYNQLHRAVRSLRGLSLLVVKPQEGGQEVIELHPLVRAFVRTNFPKPQRDWFIQTILDVYKALFRPASRRFEEKAGSRDARLLGRRCRAPYFSWGVCRCGRVSS